MDISYTSYTHTWRVSTLKKNKKKTDKYDIEMHQYKNSGQYQ